MNKAFQFRIKPNSEQIVLLYKTFGCCRWVYNQMLAEKIAHYEKTQKSIRLTPAMYKSANPWLKEVDSLALANVQLNLESGFSNFFRDKNFGFPNWKKRHSGHYSYTTNLVNDNIKLDGGYLKLPKLGKLRIKQHRQIPSGYRLKSVTVSKTPTDKFYASILYEYDTDIIPVVPVDIVGLDYSMPELFVPSEGEPPNYPKPYRTAQEKLAKEQRKLSRRKKGGSNYKKQKRKVANIHEHIANQRKDFLHKQSRSITKIYDAVCIEDLSMKGMAQALNFGKSVSDNGWGMFTRMLEYKLIEQGKSLVKIDKWFPSSKKCSSCSGIIDELPLSVREYRCKCGFVCDRDRNAAINIRNEGKRILGIVDTDNKSSA
jgi:putative transposase